MDAEIIDLVARRMELSSKIGAVKNNCNMTVYQPVRWREIVETRGERGLAQGLTKEFVVDLYEKIHHESIRLQLAILDQNNSAAEQDKPNQ
jgi:chorismate mutase